MKIRVPTDTVSLLETQVQDRLVVVPELGIMPWCAHPPWADALIWESTGRNRYEVVQIHQGARRLAERASTEEPTVYMLAVVVPEGVIMTDLARVESHVLRPPEPPDLSWNSGPGVPLSPDVRVCYAVSMMMTEAERDKEQYISDLLHRARIFRGVNGLDFDDPITIDVPEGKKHMITQLDVEFLKVFAIKIKEN